MLISLGKEKLKNRFIYLGILKKEEMYKIYNTCDIFCMPAINEAFGTIIIEAMAANKPVVVNDEEDRHWMINDAGVFTDMADVNKIAESLLKAYNINWGNKPRLQAEKFSWDIIFSKYNSLILELIQQKKKGFN